MLVLLFFFRKSHLNSFFIDEGKVAFCVLFENYSFEDGTTFFHRKGYTRGESMEFKYTAVEIETERGEGI